MGNSSFTRGLLLRWILALAASCFALGTALLILAPRLLVVEQDPSEGEAIILLGGDLGDRADRALQLYTAGKAPIIVVTGSYDSRFIASNLSAAGLPASCLILEERATSTWEDAVYTTQRLRDRGISRVILVTSWFHSRRALAVFAQQAGALHVTSAPATQRSLKAHSTRLTRIRIVLREFCALLWYKLRYGAPIFSSPESLALLMQGSQYQNSPP